MQKEDELMLEALAKRIRDLENLVRTIREGTPSQLTWQRQLADQLADVDVLLQVLRMTIAMGRPDSEIRDSATSLHDRCHRALATLAGTRADATTKAAMRLALDLARSIKLAVVTC